MSKFIKTRVERDSLGELEIPSNAYWGIHTERAHRNFPISGISLGQYPELIRALAMVKKAAVRANCKLGVVTRERGSAIELACNDIIIGKLHDQFIVDMIQGGAGTSTNMNANEVIANCAIKSLGGELGEYARVSPYDDVNCSQSTNDAYPTAVRLSLILSHNELATAMENFATACENKAIEFADVVKLGRTQLQDAVPMTLGREFQAFATTIREDVDRLREVAGLFKEMNLGATAIGTGLNTHKDYASLAIKELGSISGVDLVVAHDLIEATSDMGAFVAFSGILKRIAVKLSKICNDLRLLSSGPRCGFGEITLPPMQAGSSIMPGKVNPVIPEVLNQISFLVIGNDVTITFAAEGGQLQLNAFEPVIAFRLLNSVRLLTQGLNTLTGRCIIGIVANREICQRNVELSIGLATALNPYIGYERSSELAKKALKTGKGIFDVAKEEGVLSPDLIEEIMRELLECL